MKKIVTVIIGVIASLLGSLWFLQGADIVHLNPILCFSNCEVITGGSTFWEVIGVVVLIIGIIMIFNSIKSREHHVSK
ncbi:hypothetical protein BH09PAT1_BH09PAT1_8210 [soil metagenome]